MLLLRLLNPHVSLPFSNLSTGLRSANALNINFFLLPTKFLQPVNLAMLTIWSLFNPLALPAPHRLSPFLAHQTISSLKITDRSFRYASPHLWNQLPDSFLQPHQSCLDSPPHSLSAHLYYHHHSQHPSLFHSRLKTYFFNKSFPSLDFFYLLDCLHDSGTGPDLSRLSV